MLTPDLQKLVDAVKDAMPSLTADERLEVMEDIREGWCRHCGGEAPCCCWNDE